MFSHLILGFLQFLEIRQHMLKPLLFLQDQSLHPSYFLLLLFHALLVLLLPEGDFGELGRGFWGISEESL
jgi:hypothetical protein